MSLLKSILCSRATRYDIELAPQVVPDSMDPIKVDDCIVPEQQEDSTSSLGEMTFSATLQNSSVQLAHGPIYPATFHADHTINTGQLISVRTGDFARVHLLNPVVAADLHAPQPRTVSSGNPFIPRYSSAATSLVTGVTHINLPSPQNTAILNSLGPSSSLNSSQLDTVNHRYPLALSLSTDSYFSTPSGCASTQADAVSLSLPPSNVQSSSQGMRMPVGRAQHYRQPRVSVTDNYVDSLVTVRMSRHSLAGASVAISTARPSHAHGRHSFSEGDRPNPHLLVPPHTHSQAQRRRRNSSGCEHSVHQSPTSLANRSGSSSDLRRRRRRSHDSRAEQTDLSTSSDVVPRRRRSHSSPFRVPFQISPIVRGPTTTH